MSIYKRPTIETLKKLYKNTGYKDTIKDIYIKPKSVADFNKVDCNKLWRLNNLYHIQEKKTFKRIKFVMNTAQHLVYRDSLIHPRLIILKSRQQGISTLWLISFFDDCIFNNDYSIGLMAYTAPDAEQLLKKVKFTWKHLPQRILELTKLKIEEDNKSSVSFNNGSTIRISTSFRSASLSRFHLSEFGKISAINPQKAKEALTGSLQTLGKGNKIIIEIYCNGRKLI